MGLQKSKYLIDSYSPRIYVYIRQARPRDRQKTLDRLAKNLCSLTRRRNMWNSAGEFEKFNERQTANDAIKEQTVTENLPRSKQTFYIFSDGSFASELKIGIGATVTLNNTECLQSLRKEDLPIKLLVMKADNIARLELATVLWALEEFRAAQVEMDLSTEFILITDSKTIENLPARRAKLEAKNYLSQRTGLPLSNADLYRKFFLAYDDLKPNIRWIKGHSPSRAHSNLQRIFAYVDHAARQRLREYRKQQA